MEEKFTGKEAFVANVDLVLSASDRMGAHVLFKVLCRVCIVPSEFLDHRLTGIAVVLLDVLGDAAAVFGRNVGRLASVSKKLLNKVGDIATGKRNVLDGTPDDIALGLVKQPLSAASAI